MSNITMIQKVTVGFGLVYVLIGILGFVPGITVATAIPGQGLLLGIFAVNLIHNIAHLLLGAILIAGGMMPANTVMVNKVMAVIFAVLVVGSAVEACLACRVDKSPGCVGEEDRSPNHIAGLAGPRGFRRDGLQIDKRCRGRRFSLRLCRC